MLREVKRLFEEHKQLSPTLKPIITVLIMVVNLETAAGYEK